MAGRLIPLRDEEVIARVSMPDQQHETSESNRFFDGCLATRGHRLARYPLACRSVSAETRSLFRTKLFWADPTPPTPIF
jgi:hypothetical protein